MADAITFQVTDNGDAELLGYPTNYFISQKGGIHEMVVHGGPIISSFISPYLAIPGREFVPILENNLQFFLRIGARPFHAFLVGLQLKFITSNYDGNPVEITLWT